MLSIAGFPMMLIMAKRMDFLGDADKKTRCSSMYMLMTLQKLDLWFIVLADVQTMEDIPTIRSRGVDL